MTPLRKYLVYSTILGLFSDRFMLNVGPIHLLYFYAILLVNLAILTVEGFLWMPDRLLVFLGCLVLSGIAGIVTGLGSFPGFVKDIAGILPSALYFAAFYRYMRFDVRQCFALYARFAFYVAAFGIFYLPFQPWGGGRLMSICLEPSTFCLVCVPGAFYYLDLWQRRRQGGRRLLVMLLAIALSQSSLGYMGVLFGIYLFGRRYRLGKTLAPGVVLLLGALLFNYSALFRVRVSDTFAGTSNGDVSTINISTFGVLANFYVTREAFRNHPIAGGGLGSYVTSHERYLSSVPGVEFVLDEDRLMLGQWDASSLLLRITAEFGLIGLIAAAWFLISYYPRKSYGSTLEDRAIAMSIICYLFMKFMRDGSYFNPEVFFFFASYAVLGALAHQRAANRQSAHRPVPTAASLALPQPGTA